MLRALVLFLWLSLTPVWAISYTVQLFASSDEAKASQLQAELAGQGYKAYLLRVPTAQGQVYRIRVGVFGNRAAAALFAQVMPSVEGSTPSPALAEGGVPQDFIPLQPALLGQYDLETTLVQVFPWPVPESVAPETTPQEAVTDETAEGPETLGPTPSPSTPKPEFSTTPLEETPPSEPTANAGFSENVASQPVMAIRVQPRDASEQAHYRIGDLEFEAWQAAPEQDGWILRVRSFPVWPDDWQTTSEVERTQYRETVLANLSGDLDLTPQQLEPFVFELPDKAPFIIVVERFNPETQQIERLRMVGQPRPNQDNLGLTLNGPAAFFGEAVDMPTPQTDTIFEVSEDSDVPDQVSGSGWQASRDDDYVVLTVEDKSWRAAVGQPLWGGGDLLVALYNKQALIYQLQQP